MHMLLILILWCDPDVRRLSDEDWSARERAHARLGAVGLLAVPALLASTSRDAESRRRIDTLLAPHRRRLYILYDHWLIASLLSRDLDAQDFECIERSVWDDTDFNESVIREAVRVGWIEENYADEYHRSVFRRGHQWRLLLWEIRQRSKPE